MINDETLLSDSTTNSGVLSHFVSQSAILHTTLLTLSVLSSDVLLDAIFARFHWAPLQVVCICFCHGLVSLLAWALLADLSPRRSFVVEGCVYAVLLTWLFDVDHFWTARSLWPSAAFNAASPGFLHCVVVPLGFSFFLWVYEKQASRGLTYGKPPALRGLCWLVLLSWTCHVIYDASRVGVRLWSFTWPWPFLASASAPLSIAVCLASLLTMIWFLRFVLYKAQFDFTQVTIVVPDDLINL